jgi:hypothetical protein
MTVDPVRLRFADGQMKMLEHPHITQNQERTALSDLFRKVRRAGWGPLSQEAREMGHSLHPLTYRRACPVEFDQTGYTAKHTPNAPRVSVDRIEHLSKASTGTKVTGAVTQLR